MDQLQWTCPTCSSSLHDGRCLPCSHRSLVIAKVAFLCFLFEDHCIQCYKARSRQSTSNCPVSKTEWCLDTDAWDDDQWPHTDNTKGFVNRNSIYLLASLGSRSMSLSVHPSLPLLNTVLVLSSWPPRYQMWYSGLGTKSEKASSIPLKSNNQTSYWNWNMTSFRQTRHR